VLFVDRGLMRQHTFEVGSIRESWIVLGLLPALRLKHAYAPACVARHRRHRSVYE